MLNQLRNMRPRPQRQHLNRRLRPSKIQIRIDPRIGIDTGKQEGKRLFEAV